MDGAASSLPTPRGATGSRRSYFRSSSRLGLKRPTAKRIHRSPDISKSIWLALPVTLAVDAVVALVLTYRNVVLTTSLLGTLGSLILLAIGVANVWALYATLCAERSWARDSIIAQLFMLALASYLLFQDQRNPFKHWNFRAIALVAVTVLIALIAVGWIIFLWSRASLKWTKGTVILTTLVPLAGSVQFLLQNYYIPQTLMPQVDLSVALSSRGKASTPAGQMTRLSAQVTVHNRGTVPVDVAGALMRVTWYPTTAQQPIYRKACDGWDWRQPWCQIAGALADLGGPTDSDYRVNPTPGEDAQLSYAGYYMSGFGGILTPGETDTVEREVDIPGGFRVARLSASGIFFNQRRIKEIRPCSDDLPDDSTQQAIPSQAGGHFLCIDYEIAPANVLDELVAARQVVRVWVITDAQESAEQGNEYPRIDSTVGTAWDMSKKKGPSEVEEFEEANPMGSYTDVSAEYAPTDVTPSSGKK